MKFPRITNPLFAISLVIVSFAAFAEPVNTKTNDEKPPEWTSADTNRDGYLTKEEFIAYGSLGRFFDEMDTNGDQKISEEEYSNWIRDHK